MKRISTIIGLALVLALFASCNKSNEEKISDDQLVPIKVGADVTTKANVISWNDSDKIGITMFKKGTLDLAEGNFKNKSYVTALGSSGIFSASDIPSIIYFPKDGSLVDFMSYYPHSTQMTANYIMPLDITDQSSLPKIDFMTGQHLSGDSKDNPSVKLRFSHKLSKVIFNLSLPSGDTNIQRLVGSTITIQGMFTKGTYDLNNTAGVVIDQTSTADLPIFTNTAGSMAAGIVFPRESGVGIVFQIALTDGAKYTAHMSNTLTLLAGYQYTFNITLQKTPIEVTADITEWIPGGSFTMDAH